ncbi:protein mono-ADP-ribosyltransferase PARP14-like [Hyperolius riggenbachi]|uniref:protein mono-ADP-ribosyltransferase PARP14-like n=1 Tax=Hyperolius riggenbachi TaxID=752182 RepID=UPI0035A2E587
MGDSDYRHPLALLWQDGPERLKRIKNKLLLYLQNKSKSGGGDCEFRDTDCSDGYILIYFQEQEARDRVLQRGTHQLKLPNGEKLELNITVWNVGNPNTNETKPLPKAPQSGQSVKVTAAQDKEVTQEEPSSSLVLIQNVRESCTAEMLNLLVENTSDKMEDVEFHVERIPDIQAAVVTFTCDIDIPGFIQAFSSSIRVNHNKLTAKTMEDTRSVRVENLPEVASEEHLATYFENPRKGGGHVEEVVVIAEERAALVKFGNTRAVKRVLKMEHVFCKTKIFVYPYYPLLRVTLYGRRGPRIEIPKPIEFPISPYILEHIMNDGDLRASMDEKMKSKHCEIIWPDLGNQNPVLKLVFPPSLSTQLRTMTKVLLKWKDEVYNTFSLLISKYKVIEYKMDQLVWEAFREHVGSPTYDGVLIKPDFPTEKVFLAGLSKDVTKLDPMFRKLIDETTSQIERKTRGVTEPIAMSPVLYKIICNSGLQKKILEQVPQLKIVYDVPTKRARLSGLRDEVLTAKCEILNMKQELKSKSIQINPHLILFLVRTDNEELSERILLRNNINALMEIEDDSVKLTAYTKEDLIEAEKQINQKLLCRQIPVEDKRLLRSPEWRSLNSHLLEAFNAEKSSVLILECTSGAPDDVVIAGLSSVVQDCYQQVSDFMERNTTIQRDISVKSMAVMQFIQEERREMWQKLQDDVIVINNRNGLCLSGPRMQVQEASSLLENIISSLHLDTLRIDKPGAKKYCKDKEEELLTAAQTKFKCVICLEAGGDYNPTGKLRYQVTFPNGITLSVYKDDLCRHKVDVIVNAANEDLQHIGGLAKAIQDAAGQKLKDESDRIIRRDGRLSTGDAVITGAGNLPCKQVIHTVGPRWDSTSASRCERLLRKAITSSLQLASERGLRSIAIPAVSSGVFGFPLKPCIENIMVAIQDYVELPGLKSALRTINLVDTIDETVRIFSEVASVRFGKQRAEASAALQPQTGINMVEKPQAQVTGHNDKTVMTNEGLTVKLIQKNIEDCTTDVIVNSVGGNLDLNNGAVAKALLHRAGSNIQQLLNDEGSGVQVTAGSVFSTNGCSLSCQEVLHVVTPQWDSGQGTSEKILRGIISKCLKQTDQNGWRSISLPAIGTGNLGFPKVLSAFVMFDEIFEFSRGNKVQNLQEIHLVLHPRDLDTIKAFSDELANCTEGSSSTASRSPPAVPGPSSFGTVTNPSLGFYEMMIGTLTFQVKTGDITKELANAIVNSSNDDFTLRSGVSKAILEAAGPNVDLAVATLGAQGHKGFITTHSGNLTQCKCIIHVVGPNKPSSIKRIVLDVLQECEKKQMTSVAFPALGTGAGNLAASVVADSLLDGVVDFISANSVSSLQTVKVVLFQQQMQNDFYTSMKNREGTPLPVQKSFLTRVTEFFKSPKAKKPVQKLSAFQLVEGIEPVIFSLCAEDQEKVDKTKAWLKKQIEYEQAEKVIKDECISELENTEMQKISDLQKKFQVSVTYQPPDPSIKILGLTRDVLMVSSEIETIINRAKNRKLKERSAELNSKLVEWRYKHGGNMVAFDKMINLDLEEAKEGNTAQITVQIWGNQYTVDLRRQIATDQHGKQIEIERVEKNDNSLLVPKHWTKMSNNASAVEVDVASGTPEYLDVQQKFQQTCRNHILKILRVQNKALWENYQIKKQNIDAKNGTTNNERELFHGTDLNSVQQVNQNGFNRSYAGRHAAMYGNGTYFARDASYSTNYSPADGNRQRHMYLARVLTGSFCAGRSGMIAPPAKSSANATDLYDSVTDNVRNPSMFIIFNDIQAYPEYHIIFQ